MVWQAPNFAHCSGKLQMTVTEGIILDEIIRDAFYLSYSCQGLAHWSSTLHEMKCKPILQHGVAVTFQTFSKIFFDNSSVVFCKIVLETYVAGFPDD